MREAPVFFGLFGGLLVVGAAAVLVPGVPLLILLLIPNVVGAVLLPVILILMLKVLNDSRIMGRWTNSHRLERRGVDGDGRADRADGRLRDHRRPAGDGRRQRLTAGATSASPERLLSGRSVGVDGGDGRLILSRYNHIGGRQG